MPAGLLKATANFHCSLVTWRNFGERVINKTHASIWVSQQECNSTPWLEIKHVLAVHSELFAVLAFYFPSQSKLWQMKLLIRYEGRQPHANLHLHTMPCFKVQVLAFLGSLGLEEGKSGKDPMDRLGLA